MPTWKAFARSLVCVVPLFLAAHSALATPVVFNFEGDTQGTMNSTDTVDGLSMYFAGAGTVCNIADLAFTNLSGYALITNLCNVEVGATILAFSSPVKDLTFDYAISSSDPVYVIATLNGYLVGTLTLDDNGGTGEGSRSFAGPFDLLGFDTQSSQSDYALDNISVTVTTVPEPSSIVLVGTGLLGFAGVVRRRLTA